MSQQIPIGITSLLTAAAGAVWIARVWPGPSGRHRRTSPGPVVPQAFVHCTTCGVETAATVHGAAMLCAEGHLVGGAA